MSDTGDHRTTLATLRREVIAAAGVIGAVLLAAWLVSMVMA